MTSMKRTLGTPLAAVLPLVLLLPGCATDPHTGAQSVAGVKVSDDPCAKTATVVGGVLGAVAGAVVTSQFTKSTDARVLGAVAGGGVGAAIGYNMDQRRCALFAIARQHDAEMNVTSVVVPKGDLPPAETVAAVTASPASATPFTAGNDTVAAGLSVTLRDNGKQFAAGSDKLTPEAEGMFRDVADQYSYAKQQAKLVATSTDDEKSAVETLKAKRILLVGHTDDTGSSVDNANLSERRAAAVARVFQAEGVAPANLFFQGAGETLPVADNHTDAGRAANRRVEIVDLTDDVAFHKFLATRRQALQYYRSVEGAPVADAAPAPAPAVPAKGKRPVKPATSFVDFGGVPAATVTGASDFGAGTVGAAGTPGGDRPVVPTCSADRPRVANGVKALATQKEVPLSDYVPGLYNTSWSDTVNGNLVGLTNVDVPRDGGSAVGKPTLLIWKNYNPNKKLPSADFQTAPDVNIYRGNRAILYRVFVGGPMKCMDVLFPYTDTGESRNSSLFYDRQSALYVKTFELKR